MKVIFPFIETPAIADLTIQRSPAGLLGGREGVQRVLKATKAGAPAETLAKLKGVGRGQDRRRLVGTDDLGTFATIAKAGGMTGAARRSEGPRRPAGDRMAAVLLRHAWR
jgi:hypothetical protein